MDVVAFSAQLLSLLDTSSIMCFSQKPVLDWFLAKELLMESSLPGETSAWMGPLLDLRVGRGSSEPVMFCILESYFFFVPAACPVHVPCREFSPCKQAVGNVNLAWHFPAHPPCPVCSCCAPGVCSPPLLPPSPLCSSPPLPKAATSYSLPLLSLVLSYLQLPPALISLQLSWSCSTYPPP